jgi:hypothetical protein
MREQFTDEEWETLLLAPLFANYATGRFDDEVVEAYESQAMVQTVASNMMYGQDDLTREVCQAIVSDPAATIGRMREVSGTVAAADVIGGAGRLADRMSAPGYKQFLVDVSEATANASDPASGADPAARVAKLQAVALVREILDLPE